MMRRSNVTATSTLTSLHIDMMASWHKVPSASTVGILCIAQAWLHPAVCLPVVLPPLWPWLDAHVALQHAQDALQLIVLPVLLYEVLIYI